MNRKKISKGLKFLSIAGAVMIFSATMVTADRASAGFLTRVGRGFRGIFTGHGFSGFRSARTTTTTTSRPSGIQTTSQVTSNPGSRPLPPVPTDQVKVKFYGIGPDKDQRQVSGIIDPTRRSTIYFGEGTPSGVVKATNGGNKRAPLQSATFSDPQEIQYAALRFPARTQIKTRAKTGADPKGTIYTKVKERTRIITTTSSGVNGWTMSIEPSGYENVGDLVVWRRNK